MSLKASVISPSVWSHLIKIEILSGEKKFCDIIKEPFRCIGIFEVLIECNTCADWQSTWKLLVFVKLFHVALPEITLKH